MIPPESNILTLAPETSCDAAKRSGVVLLVEDEDALAVLVSRVLQRCGWRVIYARDGAEARLLLAEHAHEIVLAFVDCGLPDTCGAELSAQIREVLPALPVLLTSGRDQGALALSLARGGPAAFLAKPYFPADIEYRIGQLLVRHAA